MEFKQRTGKVAPEEKFFCVSADDLWDIIIQC